MSAEMSIYGTASLQWTLRVVNNTIVRLKRPLMLIAANAESEPKVTGRGAEVFAVAANAGSARPALTSRSHGTAPLQCNFQKADIQKYVDLTLTKNNLSTPRLARSRYAC